MSKASRLSSSESISDPSQGFDNALARYDTQSSRANMRVNNTRSTLYDPQQQQNRWQKAEEDNATREQASMPLFEVPEQVSPQISFGQENNLDNAFPQAEPLKEASQQWPELQRFTNALPEEDLDEGISEEDLEAMFIQSSPEEVSNYSYLLAQF